MTTEPNPAGPHRDAEVEQYFTSHPDIFDVALTHVNTTPRCPR